VHLCGWSGNVALCWVPQRETMATEECEACRLQALLLVGGADELQGRHRVRARRPLFGALGVCSVSPHRTWRRLWPWGRSKAFCGLPVLLLLVVHCWSGRQAGTPSALSPPPWPWMYMMGQIEVLTLTRQRRCGNHCIYPSCVHRWWVASRQVVSGAAQAAWSVRDCV
jgi:hypothetical protein